MMRIYSKFNIFQDVELAVSKIQNLQSKNGNLQSKYVKKKMCVSYIRKHFQIQGIQFSNHQHLWFFDHLLYNQYTRFVCPRLIYPIRFEYTIRQFAASEFDFITEIRDHEYIEKAVEH